MKMRNKTQGKFHISLTALMNEAVNGDTIQIGVFTFEYKNGNLLSQ
jgi:hypothetical protein